MARKNYSKGRGKFDKPIEVKYVQISRESLNELFRGLLGISEHSKLLALWHYCYNALTNEGFESLKLKDPVAYLLCSQMTEKHFVVQNEARWNVWDNFYRQEEISFEEALERETRERKEKKSERNKADYKRRKSIEQEWAEDLENAKRVMQDFLDKNNKD